MKLKNYQEDLVLYVAGLVLQERTDLEKSESLLHDVAAYTLNRLPPRYINSERGFTRLAADHWVDGGNGEGMAGLIQVLLLVHKAIDTITERRRPAPAARSRGGIREGVPDALEYWHNLPYLIGRVTDAHTGQPLAGAVVTVYLNRAVAAGAEAGWINPYRTTEATRGFFSFWPAAERSRAASRRFALRIEVEHPDYEPFRLERELKSRGEYDQNQVIDGDQILNLGTAALRRRAG